MTESIVEAAALAWLVSLGWQVVHGPDIAPDQLLAERRANARRQAQGFWHRARWQCQRCVASADD